jgi:hypothetical protein
MSSRSGNAEPIEGAFDRGTQVASEKISGERSYYSSLLKFGRSELLTLGMAFFLALTLWYVMGDTVRDHGNLAGTDTYWHVTLVDEALQRYENGESAGPISESINAGTPYLFDTGASYPQFSYWTAVVLGTVVGSSTLSYALLMFGSMLFAQLTFLFGFKQRFGVIPAAIGAFAFGYSPFLITNVGIQGRLPAVLAVSLLPMVLAAAMNILQHPTKKWWLIGLVATTLSVSFHPMVFYMAALGMGIIAGLMVFTSQISSRRVFLAISMIMFGVLASWVFLPTQLAEFSIKSAVVGNLANAAGPGVRASTGFDSNIVPFSIRWNSFDVGLVDINENYAGIGLALAGLLAPIVAWRKNVLLFVAAAFALYVLATGTLTPLWEMLPLAPALEPRRFLFPSVLIVSMAVAAAISVSILQIRVNHQISAKIRAALAISLLVALIAFDAVPLSDRLTPVARGAERNWTQPAEHTAEGGRMFWNAIRDWAPYYFVGRELDMEITGRLSEVDLATRQGYPETALEMLTLLDTRAVLTDSAQFPQLVNVISAEGFVERYRTGTQLMLTSDRPSTRVMAATRNVALSGGAANLYWSRILPNSVEFRLEFATNPTYVDSFDAIVISGLHAESTSQIEASMLRFVENGGLIIVEEPNRSGDAWFGVEGEARPVPEVLTIGTGEDAFQPQRFAIGGGQFTGTFYDDAGETVLSAVTDEGDIVPLIQKREMGEGAIYWVCCSIGNHTIVNPGRDYDLAYAVRAFFEEEFGGYGDVWPEQFGEDVEFLDGSDFQFDYAVDEATLVVISAAPLSQRKVLVDDEIELEIIRYGTVSAIVVPAGKHQVLLTTDSTFLKPGTLVIWIVSMLATAFLLRNLWGRLSTLPPPTGGVFPTIRRWVFEPPFTRRLAVGNGTVSVCEPRIGSVFDLKSIEGHYWRVEPSHTGSLLAVVLAEVSASSDELFEFSVAQLRLTDTSDKEFSVVTMNDLQTRELTFPNVFNMVDLKIPLLSDSVLVNPGESVRGYLVFEFASDVEYPFIHDNFLILRANQQD